MVGVRYSKSNAKAIVVHVFSCKTENVREVTDLQLCSGKPYEFTPYDISTNGLNQKVLRFSLESVFI